MSRRDYWQKRHEKIFKPAYEALMKFYPFTLDDLEGEEWRGVLGYDGKYQVSNFGRVKSFAHYPKGKILKPVLTKGGYLFVSLSRTAHVFVHVLVARYFIPNLDAKPQVNHKDGQKLNCSADNLEWVTKLENEQHSWLANLRKTSEAHHNAKLTDEQIFYIRDNPEQLTGKDLSAEFGVSRGTISQIQTGQNRKNNSGQIRNSKTPPSLPNDVKEKIRSEYRKGIRGYGTPALAKKYGVSATTVYHIVKEK